MSEEQPGCEPFKNRMAKCRAKMKNNKEKWSAYLEKDRLRNFLNRQKSKAISEKEKEKKKEATRLRVKACRERKKKETPKCATPNKILGSYSCKNTLNKAISKVKKVLPFSPSKKKAIVRQLVRENLENSDIFHITKNAPKKVLSNELIDKIKTFYESDEISWQAPGKKDFVIIRGPGKGEKCKKQKRFLMVNIDEARQIFQEKFHVRVSRSKFFELRPKHVVTIANTPHNVCVCVKHANFNFLLESLKGLWENTLTPFSHRMLLNSMCCNVSNESCMTSDCKQCKYDVKTILKSDTDYSEEVKWKKWVKVEKKYEVVDQITSIQSVIDNLNRSLVPFKFHCFVKTVQSEQFEKKKTCEPGKAVIQIDFSENYSLISQDEIQSAHWGHHQVTIFTACVWYEKKVKSYAVVSNDLSHSKESSWLFLKVVIQDFKQWIYPELDHLSVFSDNCSAQFKSKYTVSNICFLAEDLNIKTVEWNSFAAGHGKGAVDGIGGEIKRQVWIQVKARAFTVNTAFEFYEKAKHLLKNVELLYVEKRDVVMTGLFLNERWKHVQEITGIRKFHHFRKEDEISVQAGITCVSQMKICKVYGDPEPMSQKIGVKRSYRVRYSDVYSDSGSELEGIEPLSEEDDKDLNETVKLNPAVGNFVVVVYEEEYFPGIVDEVSGNEIKISTMCMSGVTGWKWPVKPDLLWYCSEDVKEIIPDPVPINTRGVFHVPNINKWRLKQVVSIP